MQEETKEMNNNECFCKSKGFRKFLIVTAGTFVGGFCAISLFAALHKPPMMPPQPFMGHQPFMMQGGFYGPQHCNCPCHKKMMKKHFKEMKKHIEKKLPEAPEQD